MFTMLYNSVLLIRPKINCICN